MSIPALLVMETLSQEKDSEQSNFWRNLCQRFKEEITESEDWRQSEQQFASLRVARTFLEMLRLRVLELNPISNSNKRSTNELQTETNLVKHLGMEL